MNKIHHIALISALVAAAGCTCSKTLTGHIPGMEGKMHYVCYWQTDRMVLADSVMTDSKGDFSVKLPGNLRGVVMVTRKSEFGYVSDLKNPINTQTVFLMADNIDLDINVYWGYYAEGLRMGSGNEIREKSKAISNLTANISRRYPMIAERLESAPEDSIMNNNLVQDYGFEYSRMERQADSILSGVPEKSALRTYYSILKPPASFSGDKDNFLSEIDFKDGNLLNFPEFHSKMRTYFRIAGINAGNIDSLCNVLRTSDRNRQGLKTICGKNGPGTNGKY